MCRLGHQGQGNLNSEAADQATVSDEQAPLMPSNAVASDEDIAEVPSVFSNLC